MNLDFLLTLTFFEASILLSLFFYCSFILYESYSKKDWLVFFNPVNFFALLTLFYCVIGPIISSANSDGSMFYRAVDHREYYQIGLFAALISVFTFKLGFEFKNNFRIRDYGINKLNNYKKDKRDYLFLFKWSERILLFALGCQFIVFGIGYINKIIFFRESSNFGDFTLYQGDFQEYLTFTLNFLIFAIPLMFLSLLKGVKEKTKFIFYISISVSLFINFAFRWRLFLLFLPILLIYFFHKKTKPNIIFLFSFVLSTFLFFGFIQISRTYGRGINIDTYQKNTKEIKESKLNNVLRASFFDSNVFNTSAAMIHKTPSENDFVGLTPFLNALLLPIPRTVWPDKPTAGKYVTELYKKIYPGKFWEVGAACLGFAEYFISGGWIALVILNFLLGYLYKRLWIWFFYNFYDPIAQISYALYFSFLFIIYSRGYFLQIAFLYLTVFTPLILLSYLWNKRFIS
tara:strand:+ start:1007 stop:2383 length:1377 start_codon:yes stop_codon:yes gene_type:complete